VDNLRNRFVRKRRRTDIDQRPEPGHRRSRSYAAEAKLSDGRRLDPARMLLAQARESRLTGSRAYQAAADQYHALVLFHDFFQRANDGLSKGHFLRHGLITSSCVSKVKCGFWIRERAFQGETRRGIGFRTNRLVKMLDLLAAEASAFDELAREDKHGIAFCVPRTHRIRYAAGIPSPRDIGQTRNELGMGAVVARPGMRAGLDKKWSLTGACTSDQLRRSLIRGADVATVNDRGFDVESSRHARELLRAVARTAAAGAPIIVFHQEDQWQLPELGHI